MGKKSPHAGPSVHPPQPPRYGVFFAPVFRFSFRHELRVNSKRATGINVWNLRSIFWWMYFPTQPSHVVRKSVYLLQIKLENNNATSVMCPKPSEAPLGVVCAAGKFKVVWPRHVTASCMCVSFCLSQRRPWRFSGGWSWRQRRWTAACSQEKRPAPWCRAAQSTHRTLHWDIPLLEG